MAEPRAAPPDLSEALYSAVREDEVERLELLLAEGANADTFYDDDHNISSKSILHVACGKGRTECVRALLVAGATPDIHDKWGQSPLHYCISLQFLDTVHALLDGFEERAKEIVNNQDCFGKAPLHCAADSACVEALELLINHGADVNVRNLDGITPLMVCAQTYGKYKTVQAMDLLLKAGALIDSTDYRSQRSALQKAAMAKNVAAVELLLSAGAEVDSLDTSYRTALTNIMWDHVKNREGECHIDSDVMTIVVLLSQAGANLDLAFTEYSNPLVTASFLKAAPLVRFFLDQGAQPNVKWITPLLVATSKKDMECVKLLLYHNCRMDIKGQVFRKQRGTQSDFDPVEMALDDGSYSLFQLFLSAGYDIRSVRSQLLEVLKTNSDDSPSVMSGELHQWFMTRISQPPSLQQLIVYWLRSSLDQRLHKTVPRLPLPSRLRDAIFLTDLLT